MMLRRLHTSWVTFQPESVISEESNHASPERDAAIDEEVGGAGDGDLDTVRTSQRGDWRGSSTEGCTRCILGMSQRDAYWPTEIEVDDDNGVIWVRKENSRPAGSA